MKIAVPTSEGSLSPHFGRCEEFVLFDVDPQAKQILATDRAVPPPHGPGVIPQWLSGFKVNVIIAGGMGMRAIQLFQTAGIEVVRNAVVATPEELVRNYLNGQLTLGEDPCDHPDGHDCGHHEHGHNHEH